MTYNFDYSQYKKKISTKNNGVVPLLCIVIILLLGLAYFLSAKNTSTKDFYFVEIANFESYKQANSLALDTSNSQGAGFVYFDGSYHVLASFYQTEQQAQSVVENLKENYPNSCIFALKTTKHLKTKTLSQKQSSYLNEFISVSEKQLNSLADFCINYDKKTLNYSKICLNVKEMHSILTNFKNNLENLFKNNKFKTAEEYSLNLCDTLKTISNLKENSSFSAGLKFQTIKFAVNYFYFLNVFA